MSNIWGFGQAIPNSQRVEKWSSAPCVCGHMRRAHAQHMYYCENEECECERYEEAESDEQ